MIMKELTVSELLYKLEQAQTTISKTVSLLNDTGDFESETLDKAATQAERVMRLLDMAYSEFNQ